LPKFQPNELNRAISTAALSRQSLGSLAGPPQSVSCVLTTGSERVHKMMFTIEFFRIRKEDNARAMLDRITHIASDLESAKVKAKSLFDTLNMPQTPDGLRILDQYGHEVFFWTPRTDRS
jgi:hypothetical protein